MRYVWQKQIARTVGRDIRKLDELGINARIVEQKAAELEKFGKNVKDAAIAGFDHDFVGAGAAGRGLACAVTQLGGDCEKVVMQGQYIEVPRNQSASPKEPKRYASQVGHKS